MTHSIQTIHELIAELATRIFANDATVMPLILVAQFATPRPKIHMLPTAVASTFFRDRDHQQYLRPFALDLLSGRSIPDLPIPFIPDCVIILNEASIITPHEFESNLVSFEQHPKAQDSLVITYYHHGPTLASISPFIETSGTRVLSISKNLIPLASLVEAPVAPSQAPPSTRIH